MSTRARIGLFLAVVVAASVGAGAYVQAARAPLSAEAEAVDPERTLDDVVARDHVAFVSNEPDASFGRVVLADLDDPDADRVVTDLTCDRVDVGERDGEVLGICLRSDRGVVTTFEAVLFDGDFAPVRTVDLAGSPSRTRLSPDGTRAGITVFVAGHSYLDSGFSTRTSILDTATGDELAELESFAVLRDGEPWRREDANLWGVTWIDEDAFHATLGTLDDTHLVRGSLSARTLEVVADHVECPSLSPDGTRVAFKHQTVDGTGRVHWQPAVLELATGEVTLLAEDRHVDDQITWLDDGTVVYGLRREGAFSPATDLWAVPADGTGEPTKLATGAWSPAFEAGR